MNTSNRNTRHTLLRRVQPRYTHTSRYLTNSTRMTNTTADGKMVHAQHTITSQRRDGRWYQNISTKCSAHHTQTEIVHTTPKGQTLHLKTENHTLTSLPLITNSNQPIAWALHPPTTSNYIYMHSLQTEVEFMTKQCKLLGVKIVILEHWSLQQLEYLVETWSRAALIL